MAIDYNKFCKRCKHYDFSISDGILCGLTRTKPAFEGSCPEFELDAAREKQLINRGKIRADRKARLEAYSEDYGLSGEFGPSIQHFEMRTANPALGAKTFQGFSTYSEAMTVQGAVNKIFILLMLTAASAFSVWTRFFNHPEPSQFAADFKTFVIIGSIVSIGLAIVTVFRKHWAATTGVIYALLQGFTLGGITAIVEAELPGAAIAAVTLTFTTLLTLLLAYTSGWIKPTENFKLGVIAATGGIVLIYILAPVIQIFAPDFDLIHKADFIGFSFNLSVAAIAALNLILDFDFIEEGAEKGAPKYMEWYAAFGLLITLVWLYLEILRLMLKAKRRK